MVDPRRPLELVEVVIQCPDERYHCHIRVNEGSVKGDIQPDYEGGYPYIKVPCKCGKVHRFVYHNKVKRWMTYEESQEI